MPNSDAGPSPWTPMGIVDGYGKFFRAAKSPYPSQRRAVRRLTFGAIGFVLAVVVVALIAGR